MRVLATDRRGQKVRCDLSIKTYRDLDTWQVGMTVVEQTYGLTTVLPETERFGLCSQMRRAAVSIPSNVAESHGRGVIRGCLYFLSVSIGSTAELDTQLEATRRLRFVTADQARDLQLSIDRVRQLLYGLRREKERQIATPIASFLLFLLLSGASLFS
jgi:four helix bundle protein